MDVLSVIQKFDQFLEENGHMTFEATIVGGAALTLLKLISRATNDVDILYPKQLPSSIRNAAEAFAKENHLPLEWLNCGPAESATYLPKGWDQRLENVFQGKCLRLVTLGRIELLMTKCWAYCDRERDLPDIVALKPTSSELDKIEAWLKPLDANPDWPSYVVKIFLSLRKECGV